MAFWLADGDLGDRFAHCGGFVGVRYFFDADLCPQSIGWFDELAGFIAGGPLATPLVWAGDIIFVWRIRTYCGPIMGGQCMALARGAAGCPIAAFSVGGVVDRLGEWFGRGADFGSVSGKEGHDMKHIALAWTGASGAAYGLRLLECLLAAECRVSLLLSQAARVVIKQELELGLPSGSAELEVFLRGRYAGGKLAIYGEKEWFSPLASGSHAAEVMVVCPCSMGTLGAIAHGLSDNLIERAADVMLKERRLLILVPRETPFSLIHLRNMTQLAEAGAMILPANPGFYHHPERVEDMIDFIVARILDQVGVAQTMMPRWGSSI